MPTNWLDAQLTRLGKDCQHEGIARLDAMVVRDGDRLPGPGFRGDRVQITEEEHAVYVNAVETFGWGCLRARLTGRG